MDGILQNHMECIHNPYGWHIEEPSGVDTEYTRMAYSSAICHPYGGSGAKGVKYQVKARFKYHIEHIK